MNRRVFLVIDNSATQNSISTLEVVNSKFAEMFAFPYLRVDLNAKRLTEKPSSLKSFFSLDLRALQSGALSKSSGHRKLAIEEN